MQIKPNFQPAILQSVVVTFSPTEAELLLKFISETKMAVIKELLPNESPETQSVINDLLFDLYDALLEVKV